MQRKLRHPVWDAVVDTQGQIIKIEVNDTKIVRDGMPVSRAAESNSVYFQQSPVIRLGIYAGAEGKVFR